MIDSKKITLRGIPLDIHDCIERLAVAHGRTTTKEIIHALGEYVDQFPMTARVPNPTRAEIDAENKRLRVRRSMTKRAKGSK